LKVLVIDVELQALDFCLRAIADGHQVRWFRPTKRPIGEGFPGLKIVDDYKDSLSWVGKEGLVVLTGNAKWLADLDRYREFGVRIFGPTAASAQLEIDRAKGMEVMKSVGIDLPHYETFDSLDAAEAFAKKADQPYVFKPLGDTDDKSLTYCSHSPADMVGWIQRQRARGMVLKGPCMLQEKIDMACEVGVSGWFGPEGFLPEKHQLCVEHKALMNDEKGPATGETATFTQYVETDPLSADFLLPFAPVLQALGHRGDFAIGCGVDKAGKVWPFEFTARLGWPCFYIQTASHKGDCVQWMSDLMDGKDTLKVDYRAAIGVVMALPPFPQWNGKEECVVGNPIEGLDEVWDQIHPCMMKMGKGPYMDDGKVKTGPVYQTAGEEPLVVTGLGKTVMDAHRKVYEAVSEVRYPDAMYRTDAGLKVGKGLDLLHKHGLFEAVEFGD
jgi:phosphoribosylamine--glycine ligase